jgi:hypothetical protein
MSAWIFCAKTYAPRCWNITTSFSVPTPSEWCVYCSSMVLNQLIMLRNCKKTLEEIGRPRRKLGRTQAVCGCPWDWERERWRRLLPWTTAGCRTMKHDTNNVVAAPPENISHSIGRAEKTWHVCRLVAASRSQTLVPTVVTVQNRADWDPADLKLSRCKFCLWPK